MRQTQRRRKLRLKAGEAARFSASTQSTDWLKTLAAHAVRNSPLPTTGEGAILDPTTTPNPGNVC